MSAESAVRVDADRAPDAIDRIQQEISAAEQRGELDQRRAPILEALEAFLRSDVHSYCIPAHKTGRGVDEATREALGIAAFEGDAPMHHGLEDRTSSNGILTHAQSLAAAAFGAEHCMFSTNGSTLSVQMALVACARPGEEVLIGRNAHKSVIAGTVLSGIQPVWVDPVVDREARCTHAVTPEAVERALSEHPSARAVMVVSPTAFGAAADVAGLVEVSHRHGVPLLVDDAWGALFAFHPDLPPSPMSLGADLQISSYHKSLNGIMQCSVILTQGERIDQERLQLALDSWETSSTSVLLLASMDGARRQMATSGRALLDRTLDLARDAARRIRELPRLRVMGTELVGRPGVAGFDETKVVVDVADLGMHGFAAADWLWAQRRIGPELADHRHLIFLFTVADDEHSVDVLVRALADLVDHAGDRGATPPIASADELLAGAEYPVRPRDAFMGETENVPLADSVGRVAAEAVSPYPPGVPVLVPGQVVTQQIVDYLRQGVAEDMLVEGAADPSLEKLRVVA
jgi:arginine/lysine/ornithine decarboxylase